jgi:hypothetical protein
MAGPNGRVVLVVLAVCALFLFSSFAVPEAAGRLAGRGGSDAAELLMRTRRLMPDEREEYYRTAGAAGVRPVGDPTTKADTPISAALSRATAAGGAASAAQPAARGAPLPAAGRPVRDRPTAEASEGLLTGSADAAQTARPDLATDACFGCNGGERPGAPFDRLTGCNRIRRPYHTLLTSSSGTYQLWQSRVMHHHFLAQRARDPCGEMAGFTRLHTTRDAVPDAFGCVFPPTALFSPQAISRHRSFHATAALSPAGALAIDHRMRIDSELFPTSLPPLFTAARCGP